MRISDWSSDVCSSDLIRHRHIDAARGLFQRGRSNFYAKSIQISCVARGSAVAPEFSMKLAAGLRLSLFCALIALAACQPDHGPRSAENTHETQSLMRLSFAVFCMKKKHYKISKKT